MIIRSEFFGEIFHSHELSIGYLAGKPGELIVPLCAEYVPPQPVSQVKEIINYNHPRRLIMKVFQRRTGRFRKKFSEKLMTFHVFGNAFFCVFYSISVYVF